MRVIRPKSAKSVANFARITPKNLVIRTVNLDSRDFYGNKIDIGVETQKFKRLLQVEFYTPVKFSRHIGRNNFLRRQSKSAAVAHENFSAQHAEFLRKIENVVSPAVAQKCFFVVVVQSFNFGGICGRTQ